MPYTAEKPKIARDSDELRRTIPGWGVDLEHRHRPAVPKENFRHDLSGAHWDFPERQEEQWPRERSTEHKFLTPVFGTSCPPRGISGLMRKAAYRLSEGRVSHWLMLAAADRVDVIENRVLGVLSGRPDNLITETGIQTEFSSRGFPTRFSQGRADMKHLPVDPMLQVGIWLVVGSLAFLVGQAVAAAGEPRRRRRRY